MGMAHEAKWRRLGGEVGFQRPRRQQVIEDRVRVQGSMGQLDALMDPGRTPLSDLLAIGMRQLLTGPFECTPSRIVEPFLIQLTSHTRLMVPLEADLGLGHHPQAIIRKGAVTDHVAQHQHLLHAQQLHLRKHRL